LQKNSNIAENNDFLNQRERHPEYPIRENLKPPIKTDSEKLWKKIQRRNKKNKGQISLDFNEGKYGTKY
jgi:hypothetical protein